MNVCFSSLVSSLLFFLKHEISPLLQQAFFKIKSGEDQKSMKFTAHQNWRTPPQPARIVSPQRQTRNLPIKISWRDKGIKLVKVSVWLYNRAIFHRAVGSLKQRTLPKLTGQSCKSTPYLRFDEEGWATVRKSSSLNTRSDHATLPTLQDKGNKPGQIMSTEAVSCLFVVIVHLHDVWFVCFFRLRAVRRGGSAGRGRYPRTRLLTL